MEFIKEILQDKPHSVEVDFSSGLYRNEAYKLIGNHYGSTQWDKLDEELKEFQEALDNYRAADTVPKLEEAIPEARYQVVSEFIDVLNVMSSILSTDGNEDILELADGIQNFKLSRQIYRIVNNDPKVGARREWKL